MRLAADGRLPGDKDQARCCSGERRSHAGGFALPNDVAGRFIQGDESPRGSRQEAVERQIGDALQADDTVSPAALAGLQGKTNHCTTSGLLDEEPPIGLDYRLPILWNGDGVDYAGQSRILTEPDDPALQVDRNHASGHKYDEPIAGPGDLAFAGQPIWRGYFHDLLPGNHVARLGMQFHQTQRRDEPFAGRPDCEDKEPPAVPERIAGRSAATIAEPHVAARTALKADHSGPVAGHSGTDVDSLSADQRPHRAGRHAVTKGKLPTNLSSRQVEGRDPRTFDGQCRVFAERRQMPPGPIDVVNFELQLICLEAELRGVVGLAKDGRLELHGLRSGDQRQRIRGRGCVGHDPPPR